MGCCGEKRNQLRFKPDTNQDDFRPLESYVSQERKISFMYLGDQGITIVAKSGKSYDIKNSLDIVLVDEADVVDFESELFIR